MARVAAVLAVLLGSAAALQHGPEKYSAEADEVRNMMEAVRHKTEGGAAPAAVSAVAKKAPADTSAERFPGLDKDLMARADRVAEEMRAMNAAPADSTKKAALAAKSSESRRDRAARFFATHGMKSVGSMLGDTMSATAEAAALKEEAANHQGMEQAMSESGISLPKRATRSASANPSSSADFSSIDDAEDEEDQAAKARWKAVDALRHRRPRLD